MTKELDSQSSFKISTIVLYQKQDLMLERKSPVFRYAENFHISSHPKLDLRCSYMYMYTSDNDSPLVYYKNLHVSLL